MAYRNYSAATSHIVDASGFGDFTTIGAALTAASSGQTIFIRPGTYTENPTLKAGVNLTAFEGDALSLTVIINGKCTFTGGGTLAISGICLQTNSDFALAFSGSSAGTIYLKNCLISSLNNTAISYTNSNAGSFFNIRDSKATTGTTGVALYNSSSVGLLNLDLTDVVNGGSSTTPCTNSAGTVTWNRCFSNQPISSTSTGKLQVFASIVDTGAVNTTCIAASGTGGGSCKLSQLNSGTATPLTVGAGVSFTWTLSDYFGTNVTTVSGSGTLLEGLITQSGTTGSISPNTLTQLPCTAGNLISTQVYAGHQTTTWTKPAGCNAVFVECIAAGGGGGGGASVTNPACSAGGGGGGGGYAAKFIINPGASQTVTVGTGGTAGIAGNNPGQTGGNSSFGALVVANGGNGGSGSGSVSAIAWSATGGAGGTGATGDVLLTGSDGGTGYVWAGASTAVEAQGGFGGSAARGAGITMGTPTSVTSNHVGNTGYNYGSGGSGASCSGTIGAAAGGTGADGIVFVHQYG